MAEPDETPASLADLLAQCNVASHAADRLGQIQEGSAVVPDQLAHALEEGAPAFEATAELCRTLLDRVHAGDLPA
jgi:hypothetical protein